MKAENMPSRVRSFARAWARAAWVVAFTLVLISSFASTSWGKPRYKTLHTFKLGGRGGNTPTSGLVTDLQGNLYGTTFWGGAHNAGTVFELAADGRGGWKETVLHSFKRSDGRVPFGSLIFDATGNLYGTTQGGGVNDIGTVFELEPDGHGGWNETVLHKFHGLDGYMPQAALTSMQPETSSGQPGSEVLLATVLSSNWPRMATAGGTRPCSIHSTVLTGSTPRPA